MVKSFSQRRPGGSQRTRPTEAGSNRTRPTHAKRRRPADAHIRPTGANRTRPTDTEETEQRILDAAGRVERFRRRFNLPDEQ